MTDAGQFSTAHARFVQEMEPFCGQENILDNLLSGFSQVFSIQLVLNEDQVFNQEANHSC